MEAADVRAAAEKEAADHGKASKEGKDAKDEADAPEPRKPVAEAPPDTQLKVVAKNSRAQMTQRKLLAAGRAESWEFMRHQD